MLLDDYEPLAEDIIRGSLREGDRYVDIGTQLGFTAAIAADCVGSRGSMLLFEPDPAALPRLKLHLSRADQSLMPKIHLVEAACSDRAGEMLFEQSPILGHSRILQSESQLRNGTLLRIPLVKPDDVIREKDIKHIRLLKIDVEGHENSVLAGLQRTLAAGMVDVIMIEKNLWLMALPREDAAAMHALIARHGFVGMHEASGNQITKTTLTDDSVKLENLYYCRDESVLQPYAKSSLQRGADGFSPDELEELAAMILLPSDTSAQARQIVVEVRQGKIAEGIIKGEELLGKSPTLDWFRGHIAHWHNAVGNLDRAIVHYTYLLERQPANQEIRAILAVLANKKSLEPVG